MHTTLAAKRLSFVAIAALVACSGAGVRAQTRSVDLSRGTVVAVRLKDPLSSNDSQEGDRFTATVDDRKSSKDWGSDALPPGSIVKGYVRAVKPKVDKNPGMLDLAFDRVVLPDGRSFSIQGSLISLDNKSITRDKHGRLVANKTHSTDRLTYVGYGAGAGALIGLITSRKHVVEDTLLGAGAGLLAGALDKGKSPGDVKLKAGTQMGVRLDKSFAFGRR